MFHTIINESQWYWPEATKIIYRIWWKKNNKNINVKIAPKEYNQEELMSRANFVGFAQRAVEYEIDSTLSLW